VDWEGQRTKAKSPRSSGRKSVQRLFISDVREFRTVPGGFLERKQNFWKSFMQTMSAIILGDTENQWI
jgi:hypothetical protein